MWENRMYEFLLSKRESKLHKSKCSIVNPSLVSYRHILTKQKVKNKTPIYSILVKSIPTCGYLIGQPKCKYENKRFYRNNFPLTRKVMKIYY